jgi:hypothetical protein
MAVLTWRETDATSADEHTQAFNVIFRTLPVKRISIISQYLLCHMMSKRNSGLLCSQSHGDNCLSRFREIVLPHSKGLPFIQTILQLDIRLTIRFSMVNAF